MDEHPVGSILDDRFVIEQMLGQGGMGVVLRARDRRLGRQVAIKVLSQELTEDASSRARFLREARASARLNHPHVVQIFDVGETARGEAYLVMELVAGRSLRALRDDPSFGLAARARCLVEVARALAAAHAQGIVHRDIKPDNVMLRQDGRAVVLDFGIAKHLRDLSPGISQDQSATGGSLTRDGVVLGTPAYLAPEQVLAEGVDGRSDQFAWGVTAYELLTGALPWRATRPMMVMAEIVERSPAPPSEACSTLPLEFDGVILRAMARSPEMRFANMDLAADALSAAAGIDVPRSSVASPSRVSAAPVEDISNAPTLNSTPPADPDAPREASPPEVSREATTERPARPRRRLRYAMVPAVALVAAAALALRPRAKPSPLSRPGTTLACPLLAVDRAAQGWLGAAGASALCRRLSLWMGGAPQRVLLPAALAGIEAGPLRERDPFVVPGIRERSLARARGASVWLDGAIAHDGARFRVTLTLRDARDAPLASSRAADDRFDDAVAHASDALARATGLEDGAALSAEGSAWLGVDRVREALASQTFLHTEDPGGFQRQCAALASGGGGFGRWTPIARVECAHRQLGAAPPPIAVDDRSPGALALTARYHVVSGGGAEPESLARALESAGRDAPAWVSSLTTEALAEMWHTRGDLSRARANVLVSIERWPGNRLAWGRLVSLSLDDQGAAAAVFRGASAWNPEAASMWRWLAEPASGAPGDDEYHAAMASRAYLLAPDSPSAAAIHARWLTLRGEREAARAVASRLVASPVGAVRLAGTVASLGVDASEANFVTALRGAERALREDAPETLGGQHLALIETALELASILGRRAEVADRLVARVLDPTPRFGRFGAGAVTALALCTAASSAVATRCLARVDALVSARHFLGLMPSYDALREGAGRYVAGDPTGATAAWRRLVRDGRVTATLLHGAMADAFDRAGEGELADRLDLPLLRESHRWGGATLAHARCALRARARGETERARVLATAVTQAWVTAEGSPPAVREMRDLLATLSPR